MNHAAMAIALFKAAAAIEALADWMPPCLANVLKPHASTLNKIAEWHSTQTKA